MNTDRDETTRSPPAELGEQLHGVAARLGISVSAYAGGEPTEIAARADNAALLESLPDLGIDAPSILETLHESRSAR